MRNLFDFLVLNVLLVKILHYKRPFFEFFVFNTIVNVHNDLVQKHIFFFGDFLLLFETFIETFYLTFLFDYVISLGVWLFDHVVHLIF